MYIEYLFTSSPCAICWFNKLIIRDLLLFLANWTQNIKMHTVYQCYLFVGSWREKLSVEIYLTAPSPIPSIFHENKRRQLAPFPIFSYYRKKKSILQEKKRNCFFIFGEIRRQLGGPLITDEYLKFVWRGV